MNFLPARRTLPPPVLSSRLSTDLRSIEALTSQPADLMDATLPWPAQWALLSQALIEQLYPEALQPLKVAFDLGGAVSMASFFAMCDQHKLFTGPDCVTNVNHLVEVLEGYKDNKAVAALRAASPSFSPSVATADLAPLLGFPPESPANNLTLPQLTQLVDLIASAPASARIGVVGMGGVGKSHLVAAAINEQRVRAQYSLIFWMGLGKQATTADRLALLGTFSAAVWPQQAPPVTDTVKKFALSMQVNWLHYKPPKPVLVVLDDAWSKEDADMFANVPVVIVLTTRTKSIATDAFRAASLLPLDPLPDAEQDRMLLALSGVAPDTDREARSAVRQRCGGLLLAISVVASMVRERAAEAPWRDALSLFDSNAIGTAPIQDDQTVYASLLTSGASLNEALAAQWTSLCVFPTAKWVSEGLVELFWRVAQPQMRRPDVHAQLAALFSRNLIEVKSKVGGRWSVRLHAMMRDALTWKLGDGRRPLADQFRKIAPLDMLRLMWREDSNERFDWPFLLPPGDTYKILASLRYEWKAIAPAQVAEWVRAAAEPECVVNLLTLNGSEAYAYPKEMWVAALKDIEPSVPVQMLEWCNLAAFVFVVDQRYARWPEVLEALQPAAVCGIVRAASLLLLPQPLDGYKRWPEVMELLQPADLHGLLANSLGAATGLSLLGKQGFARWDILEPAAVAAFLQHGGPGALETAYTLAKQGYTRWKEVDSITGPEIALQRTETQSGVCTIV